MTGQDTNRPRYIIMERATTPSASCWGRYVRIALVEVEEGFRGEPKMISQRARGVKRIIQTWENCHVGKMSRCAAARARAEAEEMIAKLEEKNFQHH